MSSPLLRVAPILEVLAEIPDDAHAWLSPSERMRLQRLQIASRRNQYLSGHWLARCLLAQRFGGAAIDYALEERPNLPPAVVGVDAVVHLSLSHSADWIAAAVSAAPIGIDIEQRVPARAALFGFQHLLLAEGELPDSLSADELLQRWVVKEAWIKRHHGSALPEHLAALRLRHAEGSAANVHLLSAEAFHLGIASASATPDAFDGQPIVVSRSAWRVGD